MKYQTQGPRAITADCTGDDIHAHRWYAPSAAWLAVTVYCAAVGTVEKSAGPKLPLHSRTPASRHLSSTVCQQSQRDQAITKGPSKAVLNAKRHKNAQVRGTYQLSATITAHVRKQSQAGGKEAPRATTWHVLVHALTLLAANTAGLRTRFMSWTKTNAMYADVMA